MPSPLGHALAGVAAGWLVSGAPASPTRSALATTAAFAALGAAPDIDLMFGVHSMYTHSVGAAIVVGMIVLLLTRSPGMALAAAAAWASHVLLDWLGTDGTPPIGIMALWPFTNEFYESPWHLFPPIDRRLWRPGAIEHNIGAAVWELAVLVPVVVGVWLVSRRRWQRTVSRAAHRGASASP